MRFYRHDWHELGDTIQIVGGINILMNVILDVFKKCILMRKFLPVVYHKFHYGFNDTDDKTHP